MSSVVETSHEISPCATLSRDDNIKHFFGSRAPFVISSVVETSHEISPCASLSRDDIGVVVYCRLFR